MAKEATFGTPVVPTQDLPMTGNTMDTDPGLFYPELMIGTRDLQTFGLYGEEKDAGGVEGPVFPTNGILFFTAAIGLDGSPGYGVTGTAGGGVTTTLNGGVSAGATTVTVTSATGIVANTTVIQIDVNTPSTPLTAECRLVTNVATNVLTLDAPLVYNHLTAAAVISVVSPFTHLIVESGITNIPSLTVEKNIGASQSLQFAGARVNKFDLKGQASNTELSMTCDMIAQSVALLTSPSAVTIVDEPPFVFSEFIVDYAGGQIKSPTNFNLSIDNGLKPTYTLNGNVELQFNPSTALHVNGSFDVVFDTFNDSTYGFWSFMQAHNEAAISFSATHATTGYGITVSMGKCLLKMANVDPKVSDIVMQTVPFEARRSLSASPSVTISATVTNAVHTAY